MELKQENKFKLLNFMLTAQADDPNPNPEPKPDAPQNQEDMVTVPKEEFQKMMDFFNEQKSEKEKEAKRKEEEKKKNLSEREIYEEAMKEMKKSMDEMREMTETAQKNADFSNYQNILFDSKPYLKAKFLEMIKKGKFKTKEDLMLAEETMGDVLKEKWEQENTKKNPAINHILTGLANPNPTDGKANQTTEQEHAARVAKMREEIQKRLAEEKKNKPFY